MNIQNEKIPLVVSFSGGITVAFMTLALQLRYQENKRKLIFILANTCKERSETLVFIYLAIVGI